MLLQNKASSKPNKSFEKFPFLTENIYVCMLLVSAYRNILYEGDIIVLPLGMYTSIHVQEYFVPLYNNFSLWPKMSSYGHMMPMPGRAFVDYNVVHFYNNNKTLQKHLFCRLRSTHLLTGIIHWSMNCILLLNLEKTNLYPALCHLKWQLFTMLGTILMWCHNYDIKVGAWNELITQEFKFEKKMSHST